VIVEAGPGAHALPTRAWTIQPGPDGTLTFRGACESPLFTAATLTGSVPSGLAAQVDFATPGWTGTVADGSHYLRVDGAPSPTAAAPTFYVTRASTSPTLRVVDYANTSLSLVRLCGWETTISNAAAVKYSAQLSTVNTQWVKFQGVQFAGAGTVSLYAIRGEGVSFAAAVNNPTLVDVTLRGAYLGHTGTSYLNASDLSTSTFHNTMWEGCVQPRGAFLNLGGVIKGSCTPPEQAQLSVGVFNEDNPTYGVHVIRNTTAIDFENTTRRCLRMTRSTMRIGIGASSDITCNASEGFALLDHGSFLSVGPGAQVRGTVGAPTVLRNGSMLVPLNGGWQVTNTSAATTGDFTNGDTAGVLKTCLPSSDSNQHTRIADTDP
jgi:hypothetical protein